MSLEQELATYKAEFVRTAPAGRAALYDAKIEELRANFAFKRAINASLDPPEIRRPA